MFIDERPIMLATEPITLAPEIQAILAAPLPAFRKTGLRREARKVIASEVRKLFKDMGLKGFSVTAPNYSMASSIDIRTPRNNPEPIVRDEEGGGRFTTHHPEYRAARNALLDKVEAIILAAFPDLNNRSDYMTDYFDSKLSIN